MCVTVELSGDIVRKSNDNSTVFPIPCFNTTVSIYWHMAEYVDHLIIRFGGQKRVVHPLKLLLQGLRFV